jgi:hypothetical protein
VDVVFVWKSIIFARNFETTEYLLRWVYIGKPISRSWLLLSYSINFPPVWNLKVHYRVRKSPPLVPVKSQMNPLNTSPPSCIVKIQFDINLFTYALKEIWHKSPSLMPYGGVRNFVTLFVENMVYRGGGGCWCCCSCRGWGHVSEL